MASVLRNRRRQKIITPSNSSFSNCVQDHLFVQPIRGPLETFKPVVYLDEQGRRHGRVSDHLLQRQIENDRQQLKTHVNPKVPQSSSLYGVRNPNIAALIKDVPIENENENDEEEDEDKIRADDEIKFIEYKKSSKVATSKSNNRQISSISGKQSVKFDTTPSVNMARLVDSHLTELDDIDNVDEDDSGSYGDEEELESSKHISDPDSNNRGPVDKSACDYSGTLSTSKELDGGIPTDSSLDYNRQSQDMYMPPSVEDVNDTEEAPTNELGESGNELSSPDAIRQQKQASTPSDKPERRLKSASSSRPKTAHSTRSRTEGTTNDNETDVRKSSRSPSSSSTASDDTSALLRSDNDNSPAVSDDESSHDKQSIPVEPANEPEQASSYTSDTGNKLDEENASVHTTTKSLHHVAKGAYDTSQVIQLKESFQPIINEAASYGHLDIVRKLIECGQSVHTQNILERTPLHEACVSGNEELVAELLKNGALIDQRDSRGMTALHVATSHGTTKCVRVLCEKGCDINAQDNLGQTAAHYCTMHNHVDTLTYLVIRQHIDLSISNNESKLPIHYAGKHGAKNALTFFFESYLNTSATDKRGNTIAHEASEYNQLDCIQVIWKKNRALFKTKNHSGRTPMHTASLFGSTKVLHYLLELDIIDVDQSDNNGYTMAHLAASRGHGESFSCLILHGAQVDAYTQDRYESVMDMAKRSGKYGRIEQALAGKIRCSSCEDKLAKENYDRAHARNAVEQLIHTQIQHGYNLNMPTNRPLTTLSQRNRSTR